MFHVSANMLSMLSLHGAQLLPVSSNTVNPALNYMTTQLAPACVLNKLLVGCWLYLEVENCNYGSSIFQLAIQQAR